MILEKKTLEKIESGTFEEALAAAVEAGKEYAPIWFDYRDRDWDHALHYITWKEGPKGKIPQLDFSEIYYDFSEPLKEIHRAGRENPIFAATDEGDERLEEVKSAFQIACEETFDLATPVLKLISEIRQDLSIFVPLLREDTAIPQARISGCDTKSNEWRRLLHWVKTHITAVNRASLAEAMEELAANASYGGDAGLVAKLDGKEFVQWLKGDDIYQILRQKGREKASLAIYDFNNGSGHDIESVELDWKKLRRAPKSPIGIINNFIESVFGIVGNSSIHIPNRGTGYRANIWV